MKDKPYAYRKMHEKFVERFLRVASSRIVTCQFCRRTHFATKGVETLSIDMQVELQDLRDARDHEIKRGSLYTRADGSAGLEQTKYVEHPDQEHLDFGWINGKSAPAICDCMGIAEIVEFLAGNHMGILEVIRDYVEDLRRDLLDNSNAIDEIDTSVDYIVQFTKKINDGAY